MDHWNKLGLIKKECVQLSKSVTKCLLFIIIHNFSTYTVFSTAPCIERTKSKQNQNQVTSHSNWPWLLLFNLVHKQCNGIIKGWLHYLTSESKGRFLVNNISMFGSTWCLVIDWTFRTLTNPPLPPAHPHTSNNISYMLIFAVQFPQSFERFTRNSATTVRFHKISAPEISVFYAVQITYISIWYLWLIRSVHLKVISKVLIDNIHCVKSLLILSYSGPFFPSFGLNTDRNNAEYGHFLRILLSLFF